MTIENHIKRIKEKYADNKNLQLAKLWSLGMQLGLGYGSKQLIKAEIDKLYAQGAKLELWSNDKKKRKLKDYSFNKNTTGGGVYDDLLKQIKNNGPTKMEHSFYNKPVNVSIKNMSPDEYVKECAKVLGTSPTVLRESREDGSMNRLSNLSKSTVFNLPYIDYVKNAQDGLHRAIVAEKNGTTSMPVLVVTDRDTIKSETIKGIVFSYEHCSFPQFTDFGVDGIFDLDGKTGVIISRKGNVFHSTLESDIKSKCANAKKLYAFTIDTTTMPKYDIDNMPSSLSSQKQKLLIALNRYIRDNKINDNKENINYMIKDGFGGEIHNVSGMIFRGDDGKKYQMGGNSFAIYNPAQGGYYAFNGQKGVPYCPVGGKSALKKILEDGGFISMDGLRIVKHIKDSTTTKNVVLKENILNDSSWQQVLKVYGTKYASESYLKQLLKQVTSASVFKTVKMNGPNMLFKMSNGEQYATNIYGDGSIGSEIKINKLVDKATKIVDVTASNSSELTKIINNFLASNPGFKHEDIDIRGNILSGTFRIFINGGDVLVNYNPATGGIIQHTLRVNRSDNTVNQQQVNEMVRKLYEHSNKVKEAQQVKGPAKLLYCIIEFTESDYYGLTSKVGKQISVDEAEKLIKNADEARRNDKNKMRGTYDKTYLDIVVEWGGHRYRIHFLRFDVGDGAQYMNVKQQVNSLLPRIPEFMTNASYKPYVKQLDKKTVMKDTQKLAEYRKVENGELIMGMLLKHPEVFIFISSEPEEECEFASIDEAEQYIKSKNYVKIG